MTALSDRLNEAKGDDGLDTVVARAEALGHTIDRSTFARAFKGDHAKRPRDASLRAWAAGLGVDVNELRRICDMPEGEMGVYTGPDESARLNRDQRQALDRLIKTIVAQKEGSGNVAKPDEKRTKAGTKPQTSTRSRTLRAKARPAPKDPG